jgi:chaperonin cofactor prefoldin
MIDDYSRFPIRARLVPRKMPDGNRKSKRVDVNADDVAVLIASAIFEEDFTFEVLYTDNASVNKKVGNLLTEIGQEELYEDVAKGGEKFIRFVKSIPGRPNSRGKVERALGLLNEAIDGHPGFVENEDDFNCIKAAQSKACYSLEKLEEIINNHLEELRDKPYALNRPSTTRRQLWESTGKRAALPIRQLIHFMPKARKADELRAIDNYKIRFCEEYHEGYFEPELQTKEDWKLWLLAATRRERIIVKAILLDDERWRVEACLDRDNPYTSWRRLVLKRDQQLDEQWKNQMINEVLRDIRVASKELAERLEPTLPVLHADLNNRQTEETGLATTPDNANELPGSASEDETTVPRTVSSRKAVPRSPAAPRPTQHNFKGVDLEKLWREAGENSEQ